MKDINETLFIINARTESVRVPEKIIRPFANSSLFEIAIKNLLKSNLPKNNFYVSVRDERLIKIANKHNINIWNRSKNSCKEPQIFLSKSIPTYPKMKNHIVQHADCLVRKECHKDYFQANFQLVVFY